MCPSFTSTSIPPQRHDPIAGASVSAGAGRAEADLGTALPADSASTAGGQSSSMPHSVYNLPANPRPDASLATAGQASDMTALDDTGGSLRAGAAPGAPAARQRTAVRPQLRREGPVRHRRRHHHLRQSRLGEHARGRQRDRPGGDRAAAGGRPAGRQDQDRGTRLRSDRRERLAGHAAQPARARPVPRRLELRLGRRGRRRPGRFRARLRHRRLGAHPGQLLRPVRHPPEPRRGQPGRRLPAGAQLRHLRLVRPQRRLAGGCRRGAAARRPPGGGRSAAAGRGGLGQRPAGGRRGAAPGAGTAGAAARPGGRHPACPRRASTASSTTSAPCRRRRSGRRSAAGSRR